MKRIVTLFLVLAMMLCLVACGGKGGSGTTTTEEPGNGIVYTGLLDGENAELTVKGSKAHFASSFTENEAGLTMKADSVRIGVITSSDNGVLVVDFFTEGAAVKVKMEITGPGAEAALEIMEESMLANPDLTSDEKDAIEDYYDGEMITVNYGSTLWSLFASEEDEAYDTITVTLNDTDKTFVQSVDEH